MPAVAADDPDITRLGAEATVASVPTSGTALTSSGRRISSPEAAIDHGRFAPGTIIGGRYRMIGRLGAGGMGEVYRADDLKLGQPVALKFLPEAVDKDPSRLTQLHSEVRIARQISHPHVCRVYDIDEYEGHTFLSMEYVDGEDLASLLRRVGRLAPTRAIELTRQICGALAAAHDRGVVHRDLKPANIMLDGAGQIRITDFGLAGAIGESPRAGTPAYMAPEQLAGQPVTPRSDVYALGLVLYELFTGERALEASNLAELIAKREQVDITPPTSLVRDLDPAIERVILRCLERDPARRPTNALSVAAAMPGGDPLAAAMLAGATPSPDAVAAAGEETAWALRPALASVTFVLLGLVALVLMGDRVLVTGYVSIDVPAAVMEDRAEQIRQKLGYRDRVIDSASSYAPSPAYRNFLTRFKTSSTAEAISHNVHARPGPLEFWYRTSPVALLPISSVPGATISDPPLVTSGMTTLVVDTQGRLVSFDAAPPQIEANSAAAAGQSGARAPAPAPPQPRNDATPSTASEPQPPDWNVLFAAADLPRDRFVSVPPTWTPPAYADARAAWEGTLPDTPEIKLRLEAAGYRGRVTSFSIIGPWTTPRRMPDVDASQVQRWSSIAGTLVVLLFVLGGFIIGRRHVRSGQGDRRAAYRLAAFVFLVDIARRALGGAHLMLLDFDLGFAYVNLAVSILLAVMTWGMYIALEPFVRRFWPNSLISWTRLLSGHVRDPRVGRDVLLGCVAGTVMGLITWGHNLLPLLAGNPAYPPGLPTLNFLNGMIGALTTIDRLLVTSIFVGMANIFVVVVLRALVRRTWIVIPVAMMLFSVGTVVSAFGPNPAWLDVASQLTVTGLMGFVVLRLGVLSTLVSFVFLFILQTAPLTADVGKWYFGTSAAIVLLLGAIAVAAFTWARAGEPLFGRPLLD
jgi:hypothetical protein